MSNPIYNELNSVNPQNNFLSQFMQFKQNFRGNPQEQVQALLRSGKISQQQYDRAVQMAQQFQRMFNGR